MEACKRLSCVCLAIWLGSCGASLFGPERPRARILLPDGFVGWTRLEYGVTGAPPLPVDAGVVILKYPASGVLQTSTNDGDDVVGAEDVFYYSGDRTVAVPFGFRARGGFSSWQVNDPQHRWSAWSYYGSQADSEEPEQPRPAEDDPPLGHVVAKRTLLATAR